MSVELIPQIKGVSFCHLLACMLSARNILPGTQTSSSYVLIYLFDYSSIDLIVYGSIHLFGYVCAHVFTRVCIVYFVNCVLNFYYVFD